MKQPAEMSEEDYLTQVRGCIERTKKLQRSGISHQVDLSGPLLQDLEALADRLQARNEEVKRLREECMELRKSLLEEDPWEHQI